MLIGGIILGFVYAWKIAIVGLGASPCRPFSHILLQHGILSMYPGHQLGRPCPFGSKSRRAPLDDLSNDISFI
jgi:hypothetical protein